MGRLRLYSDQRGACSIHESGFSWVAALLLPAWALQQRLYGLALVSLVEVVGVSALIARSGLPETWQIPLLVLLLTVNGFLASPLQRWLLQRRGWFVTAEEPLPSPKAQP